MTRQRFVIKDCGWMLLMIVATAWIFLRMSLHDSLQINHLTSSALSSADSEVFFEELRVSDVVCEHSIQTFIGMILNK